jgi:hypothetical protein
LLTLFLQVGEQAATEVLDVRGALAQVGVVHQFETVDVIGDHLAQRALGPLAGLDHGGHFAAQGRVVEHHQVHVEQRALFGRNWVASLATGCACRRARLRGRS